MENNLITEYQVIDGSAIVDREFNIITADEQVFRFIGVGLSMYTSIVDIIHPVDLDDFIDVSNSLHSSEYKKMVLRMRRCDNAYRWVLLEIMRCRKERENSLLAEEYLKLKISDIYALKESNHALRESMGNVRYFLALENELFCTYDYDSGQLRINQFNDNEVDNLLEVPLEQAVQYFITHGIISEESVAECTAICADIHAAKESFTHSFRANFEYTNGAYELFEVKCSTIYSGDRPKTAIGSIKRIEEQTDGKQMSISSYRYSGDRTVLSYEEMNGYCNRAIKLNPNCKLTLILMQVNDMEDYMKNEGSGFVQYLLQSVQDTVRRHVGHRGIVCPLQPNLMSVVVQDINSDIKLRAFIESLRSRIAWNYRLIDPKYEISFSFGVACYPENGMDMRIVHRKLVKALQMAQEKHANCYVIYKEHLHGELS